MHTKYAVKVLRSRAGPAEIVLFYAETQILRQLAHPYVVARKEAVRSLAVTCLVMELFRSDLCKER